MLSLLLAASLGHAAEPAPQTGPNDIGALKNSEVKVVQKMMYSKDDRSEMGVHLGVMPFDGFTFGTQLAGTYGKHSSDRFGWEVQAGAGYGFKTGDYKLLESPTYGVAVEAYRYLASVQGTVEYAPIYAKMNAAGTIFHHDVYVLAGAGLTVEQSVLPSGEFAFAPTVPLGVGARVWLKKGKALRVELRDNLMIERRAQSGTTAFKQNAVVSVGYTTFTKAKK